MEIIDGRLNLNKGLKYSEIPIGEVFGNTRLKSSLHLKVRGGAVNLNTFIFNREELFDNVSDGYVLEATLTVNEVK